MNQQPNSRRCTQVDIAKAAGVSTATVSMALRNDPRLTIATINRVLNIATKLGYKRDPTLAKLMTHLRSRKRNSFQGGIIALHYQTGFSIYSSQLAQTAKEHADRLGYVLSIEKIETEPSLLKAQSKSFEARGVDGLLLLPSDQPIDMEHTYDWGRYSVVTSGYNPVAPSPDRVTCHWFHAIRLCIMKCLQRRYQRIGCVFGAHYDFLTKFLTTAALDVEIKAQQARRIPPLYFLADHEFVPQKFLSKEYLPLLAGQALHPCTLLPIKPLKDSFLQWYRTHTPDVLIIDKEDTAQVLLPWIEATLGHSLPCAVISRAQISRFAGTSLPAQEVAVKAVELLDDKIRRGVTGLPEYPMTVLFSGRWMEGESLPFALV